MQRQQDEFFPAHMALVEAASRLYFAGVWRLDNAHVAGMPPEAQAALWEGLRDALGLKPGSATAQGVGAR